ncbi:MAG: tetratricopeptide repeat protein [Treponema sp.]|nr:tetratricopeptide repeat protein [Treponema sp.]
MKKTVFLYLIFVMVFLFSCSSAPKNQGDINTLRSQAEGWLKAGNSEAGQGKFTNALTILTEAKRNAILADDLSLIIRICFSRGNVLLSLGRTNEAFAEWNQAISDANKSGNSELISVSRIFLARGNLLSARADAQTVLNEVNRESANIKTNKLYIAFSWQAKGLALRALGSFQQAEDAFRRSLEIHEKEKNLENVSYDWYTIASIRSLSGNTQGALQALESSIKIDRRIENSWGLAASYRAMGDVYSKTNRQSDAAIAYRRAASIYRAMGNEHEASETEKRIKND